MFWTRKKWTSYTQEPAAPARPSLACAAGSRWINWQSSLKQRRDRPAIVGGDGIRSADGIADLRRRVDADGAVNGCEEISDGHRVVRNRHAVLVGRAVDLATADGAAADHHRPASGPVIAAGILIDAR